MAKIYIYTFNFLLIALLLLLPIALLAQNNEFRHIRIADGLSHDNVYTIMQDKEGYIWIGTQNGLDKYDGYTFTTYLHDPQDSCSLVSAAFGKLFQDSKGRIWIATYRGGLSCYNPKENTIKHFQHKPKDTSSILSNLVRTVVEDTKGQIWVSAARGGLHLYNEEQQNFKQFKHIKNDPTTIPDRNVNALAVDKQGYIWGGTPKGLFRININTHKIETFNPDAKQKGQTTSKVQSLLIDAQNTLWVGTRGSGVYKYIPKGKTFKPISQIITAVPGFLSKERIQCLYQTKDKKIWIGTYTHGLLSLDLENNKVNTFLHQPENSKSLSHNKVESIFEDSANNLWVGTRGGGISLLDLKPRKFTNILYKEKQANRIAGKSILSIAHNPKTGLTYFGTNAGLSIYNPKSKTYTNLINNKSDPSSFPGRRVRSLCVTKEGSLWIGTFRHGIFKLEKKDGKYSYIDYTKINDSTAIDIQINSILEDSKGVLWVATKFGLARIQLNDNQAPIYETSEENCKLYKQYITSIFEDSKQNIWVAASAGLYKYNPETNNYIKYENNTPKKKGSTISNVNQIFEDHENNLWIATGSSGLYQFNPENGTFKAYRDNSLKTGNLTAILESNTGHLWLSSGKGLSKFNRKTGQYTHFGISDGISETGFNINACQKLPSGELIFGNISGYTSFDPAQIKLNPHQPKIVLTDFKIANSSFLPKSNSFCNTTYADLNEITLTHNDYVFSVEFAALDFTNPKRNKYRYKMEGFNKEWIEFGTKRYAMFTSLPHGKYTLKVQGTNNDGIWSNKDNSIAIKVIIKPAFWQTILFKIVAGLLILTLLALLVKNRLAQLKRDKEKLEKMVQTRTVEVENQKTELIKSSQEIQTQNEKIRSSIGYAKTIQQAILPFKWRFDSFAESFIFYQAKDIVSGDFYWHEHIEGYQFIAVVDCSGHGVPGAFMSMIGSRLLKEIVSEKKIFEPNKILSKLDEYVKITLKQDQTDNRDGMDVCLIRLEKNELGYNGIFCGAKRNLIYYKKEDHKLYQKKGTRRSIGGVFTRSSKQEFKNEPIKFYKDDVIYLTTDGYIDQNSPERKRFGTTKLVTILEQSSQMQMSELKTELAQALKNFQKDSPQRDDITLIGLKLK